MCRYYEVPLVGPVALGWKKYRKSIIEHEQGVKRASASLGFTRVVNAGFSGPDVGVQFDPKAQPPIAAWREKRGVWYPRLNRIEGKLIGNTLAKIPRVCDRDLLSALEWKNCTYEGMRWRSPNVQLSKAGTLLVEGPPVATWPTPPNAKALTWEQYDKLRVR